MQHLAPISDGLKIATAVVAKAEVQRFPGDGQVGYGSPFG
jgi:hypothetical protein